MVSPAMQEREITSRIRIDELQNLLDTEEPAPKQRITAPMPAVTLEALLQPEEPPPEPIHVTFRRTPKSTAVHPILAERSAAIALPRPASDSDFLDESSSSHPSIGVDSPSRRASTTADSPSSLTADEEERETIRLALRATVQMAAAEAAGIVGFVNGVPIKVAGIDSAMMATGSDPAIAALGSNPAIRPPHSIDAVIDAAVDAAIDAEIHNFEIETAIDAVILPTPPALLERMRYPIIAASFAASFITGMVIWFLLG